MSAKRKLDPSGIVKAATTSQLSPFASSSFTHPSFAEVARVNRSKTRKHSAKYHRFLQKLDIAESVNKPLLAWYGSRGDLPWRSDLSDEQLAQLSEEAKAQRAYEVWVSEIMLQQTQVATVIPYYKKWMAKFPTVKDLAHADIEEVNALWKGLGYYSRASRLLEGAKTVVDKFNGKLPSDPEVLIKQVPGVGPYTAGAIASIAYGIQRVICRLLAIYADMKKKATNDYIWQTAEDLVPERRAGHWNQALMDLGATVCTPKNPTCKECPLNQVCLAYTEVRRSKEGPAKTDDIEDLSASANNGKDCDLCSPLDPASVERDVTLFPLKVIKKKSRDEEIAVCVVEWRPTAPGTQSKILLVKRPKTGLLAGLDEFPSVVMPEEEADAKERSLASLSLLQELLRLPKDFNLSAARDYTTIEITGTRDLGSIKHIYSHINATFHCRHLLVTSEILPEVRAKAAERCRWIDKTEVDDANISTGAVKIWNLVCGKGASAKKSAKKETAKSPKESIQSFFKSKVVGSESTVSKADLRPAHEEASGSPAASPQKRRKIVILESDSD